MIPDRNQVAELLEWASKGTVWDTDEEPWLTIADVARAFVEGKLIPAEVNYEAAAQVFADAGYTNKGIRILLDQAVDAALNRRKLNKR